MTANMTDFALNEVEAMAKKAARGAGHGWGLAEEAAKAARWLCAQGLDGVVILVAALETDALAQGASLSDRARALETGPVTLDSAARPALMLPFAALAARQIGGPVTLQCGTATAVTDGGRLSLSGPLPEGPATVTVTAGGALADPCPPATRAHPEAAGWDRLCQLAHRTYAPATEESRLLGAGAGLSDND